MTDGGTFGLLTINTGSSSVKAALYGLDDAPRLILSGSVERIGLPGSMIRLTDTIGARVLNEPAQCPNHHAALMTLTEHIERRRNSHSLRAIGHRVVHGGPDYSEPQFVTDELVSGLRHLIPVDPAHLPQAIDAIETMRERYPDIPQVACFDTAFHRHMPRVAQMYALPRRFTESGIIRYGFHGLSYEWIMEQLRSVDTVAAGKRVVIAHLGNGASMAAVRNGRGIDTTMGFSPTGGLVMGTRSGDLDPGVILYLLQSEGFDADTLSALLNKQAGLLGVSGTTADMHDLLENLDDQPSAEAVELFCYQARKFLGGLITVLGGIDTLVFTGGIGEHAAPVRARICEGLDFLGLRIDHERNQQNASIICPDNSSVTVRVMSTDEDFMIARHTSQLITKRGEARVSV